MNGRRSVRLGCVLAVTACASSNPLDRPATTLHEATFYGQDAAHRLNLACTTEYRIARSPDRIAALDSRCLPAADAYRQFRQTHSELSVAVRNRPRDGQALDRLGQELARRQQKLEHLLENLEAER